MIPSLAGAAGEIISSLDDMKKFLNGVFDYKIVSKKTMDMITLSTLDNGLEDEAKFGYGFYKEGKFIGHSGQTFGFLTKSFYNQDKKAYMIISIDEANAREELEGISKIIRKL